MIQWVFLIQVWVTRFAKASPLQAVTSAGGPEKTQRWCWGRKDVNRDDCCDTSLHGTWGNQACWVHSFTYALCCVHDPHLANLDRSARDWLIVRLFAAGGDLAAGFDLGAVVGEGLLRFQRALFLDESPRVIVREWSARMWDSSPRNASPALTAAAAVQALEGSPNAQKAVDLFWALEAPLLQHLASGLPVFALLALLYAPDRGNPAQDVESAASHENTPASASLADSIARCLGGCPARPPSDVPLCATACFSAASALPETSLVARGEPRTALEGLRSALLREGEVALRRSTAAAAGCGASPRAREGGPCHHVYKAWLSLHKLQEKLVHRASCPPGAVLYQNTAEPPYNVCLPMDTPEYHHMADITLRYGRWRDCDLLREAAIFGRHAYCIGSLWGKPPARCVAVDVGFGVGACTMYLLALGFQVYAFDPMPDNVALLRGAAWRQEEEGWLTVERAAVSDASSSALPPAPEEWPPQTPTVRLDARLAHVPGPVILKVDVEGHEMEVLSGAEGLLARRLVIAIALEVHCEMLRDRGIDPWEPVGFLVEHGFVVEVRWPVGFGQVADAAAFADVESFLAESRQIPNVQALAYRPIV